MREFDASLIQELESRGLDAKISFVGLGEHDFQVSFGSVLRLQAMEKACFSIDLQSFTWSGEPLAAPVWRLVGQTIKAVTLPDKMTLRIVLVSGDFIEFHTSISDYEAVKVESSSSGSTILMDIF